MLSFLKADNNIFSKRFITIVTVAESRHYRCEGSETKCKPLTFYRLAPCLSQADSDSVQSLSESVREGK